MKNFDWKSFKENDKIAVHVKNKRQAINFCKELSNHGFTWKTGESYLDKTNFEKYKEETCYSSLGSFYYYNYYSDSGYEILEYSDYFEDPISHFSEDIIKITKPCAVNNYKVIIEINTEALEYEIKKDKETRIEIKDEVEKLKSEKLQIEKRIKKLESEIS